MILSTVLIFIIPAKKFELKGDLARSCDDWLRYEIQEGKEKERSGVLSELALREPENTRLGVKLFGVLPVKSVSVSVAPAMELVPGGQSVGIIA